MNVDAIVDTIVDRMMGHTCDDPKYTVAQQDFRASVADFINVLDPRRGLRVNGDVLRKLGHEMYAYATVIDPKGDSHNLKSYHEQLRRVVRGWVAEELLSMMELLSDDKLASMSARKLLADHLARGDVPGLDAYKWPDGVQRH